MKLVYDFNGEVRVEDMVIITISYYVEALGRRLRPLSATKVGPKGLNIVEICGNNLSLPSFRPALGFDRVIHANKRELGMRVHGHES